MRNDHSASIPESGLKEIEGLLQQVLEKLAPYNTPLTADERRDLGIVGDKTLAFLEKGKEYIDLYGELVPPWLKNADFLVDFQDVHCVTPAKNLADQVREVIYNVYYVAGSEAYHWMLDFYHSVKQAAHRDVPNAKLVAQEMGKRFHRGKPGKTEPNGQ